MKSSKRFMWPILQFWKFTPWALVLACIWNLFELARKPMPFAQYAFSIIIGHKGKINEHGK